MPTLTLLFDGLCPICAREMAFLRRRDRAGVLEFVDIAAPGFDPGRYGLTMRQAIGAMNGVLPDGSVVVGLEVFRRAYRAVGLGWALAWTGWFPLRPLADLGYRAFARVRPRLSSFDCGERCGVGGTSPGVAASAITLRPCPRSPKSQTSSNSPTSLTSPVGLTGAKGAPPSPR